jgi:hypothetical protein
MRLFSALLAFALAAAGFAEPRRDFTPGAVWLDTAGTPIQAHGGGLLLHAGVYYWYGEDKTLGDHNRTGVAVYSSRDLYNWKREGLALKKEDVPETFRDNGVCERPKVLYNALTKQFVMWMHLDDARYLVASAGVAVSSTPVGPFRFVKFFRPVSDIHPSGAAPFAKGDRAHQDELGGTYRDMNLFQDDDGRAYAYYSSEDNWTMYVVRLSDDYLGAALPQVEGQTWARVLVHRQREGAAPFKFDGHYYLISSGCTGWAPNAATYAVADHVLGPYVEHGNPMRGPDAEHTFGAQSTYVLPAPNGPPGAFIFLADRWNPKQLGDSRYIWLPFTIQSDGTFTIDFRERWDLSVLERR